MRLRCGVDAINEFDDYARELRRAKDQEEFDRFMANRNRAPDAGQNQPAPRDKGPSSGLLDEA